MRKKNNNEECKVDLNCYFYFLFHLDGSLITFQGKKHKKFY